MQKFNNKSGFTLIEIIVVLIIIGILAAIALPNLFSNVQKSKGSTAVAAMDGLKSQIEACAVQNNVAPTIDTCNPQSFGLTASNGFNFAIVTGPGNSSQTAASGIVVIPSGTPSAGNLTYTIGAQDVIAGSFITLVRATNGAFICSAPLSGPYAGVC